MGGKQDVKNRTDEGRRLGGGWGRGRRVTSAVRGWSELMSSDDTRNVNIIMHQIRVSEIVDIRTDGRTDRLVAAAQLDACSGVSVER